MKQIIVNRINKLERILVPLQKEPIVISIQTPDEINFDQIRIDYNKENGTNYISAEWEKMDVIISRSYTEGDIENWKFDTITISGETEDSIYKKYPKIYSQYKVRIEKSKELINELFL